MAVLIVSNCVSGFVGSVIGFVVGYGCWCLFERLIDEESE